MTSLLDAALVDAAIAGDLAKVQRLISEGADVKTKYAGGLTLLLIAMGCRALGAAVGRPHRIHLVLLQWLLEKGGASVTKSDDTGLLMVWNQLDVEDADAAELSSLLKVMVTLGDAPAKFIARLSLSHAELATRGQQLRA